MLEAYEAFGDYHTMMELMEAMIEHVATTVFGTTTFTHQEVEIDLAGPFPRKRLIDLVSDAVGERLDLDQPLGDVRKIAARHGIEPDDAWGVGKIIVGLYEKLVEPKLMQPTFVLDFPQETSPLARPHREDPRFTEHFDLVIGGVEIGPAYSELNDPVDQRQRFEAQARAGAAGDEEAMTVDEDFLRALEHGMPPTGGLGFGIDRFVRLVTDSPNIREVLLFPFMKPEAEA
jgi:lysyl-tRNA synthetase, class II